MPDNDNLFGGMFDINGDGKTDLVEKYLEYNYLEEAAKSQESPAYTGMISPRARYFCATLPGKLRHP